MDDVILRPASAADVMGLRALGIQVFLDAYAPVGIRPAVAREVLSAFSAAAVRGWLKRPGSQVVVAEGAGHLIGFAHFTVGTPQPLLPASRPAELDRLYVQQPFTARGIGGRLIARAETVATAAGADAMWLSCWVHNTRALAFYARQHYQDLGSTWYEFDTERHENRVLAKTLPAR